ncbi:MAG: hypothetical protein ABL955_15075 [Elusimicrobiota bacterium]
MTITDGDEICALIAKNTDNPERLCSSLIPKHLGQETMGACVNEFARYSRDADVGKTQEGVPDELFRRYVALDRYVRAYRTKDVNACGGSEQCRVLMGEGVAISKTYEKKMGESVCGLLAKRAGTADPSQAKILLARSRELVDEFERTRSADDRPARVAIDARAEKLARLSSTFDGALASADPAEGSPRQGALGTSGSTLAGY